MTITAGPGLEDVGAWLEQLLAESTGKQGHGIVPVDAEPLGAPGRLRHRPPVRLPHPRGPATPATTRSCTRSKPSGHPVVRLTVTDPMQVGQAFFLWEFATAVAGSVIGIDPFDQPDVEASKIEDPQADRRLRQERHSCRTRTPFLISDGIKLFADEANQAALHGETLDGVIRQHLDRVHPGDYVALLAYIERNAAHIAALTGRADAHPRTRSTSRRSRSFGPRFLHSTGQAYKGGPNSGVFLQITADDAADLPVPGEKYSFGVVKAAQARGDFDVLAERKRRALRVHLGADVGAGLARLANKAIDAALGLIPQPHPDPSRSNAWNLGSSAWAGWAATSPSSPDAGRAQDRRV